MSEIRENCQKGKIIADKNILLSIIRLATKETPGVAGMASSLSQKIRDLSTSNSLDGVKISYDQKCRLNIDVYVILNYNYNVSEVAYKIQKNVKNSLSTMIDYDIKDVNVHVVDVVFSEK